MNRAELQSRKQKLNDKLLALLQCDWINGSIEEKQIRELQEKIAQDTFVVVVLGEFSRGKSTFINALLHDDVLPMDVLPETAVINVLVAGKEPVLTIINQDGTRENGTLTYDALKQFSVQNHSEKIDQVSYLRITHSADILKNNLIIVDTPGVSDMNEQRAEITYGFLPHADAVIFLLDATAPLKKTEKEFIERRVLPQGIKQIIFVANKADNLDEEELENNYEGKLQRRLAQVFGEANDLFVVSSRDALKGIQQGNHHLLTRSGVPAVEKRLLELFANEEREHARLQRLEWQYKQLWTRLMKKVVSEHNLLQTNVANLDKALQELDLLYNSHDHVENKIHDYTVHNQQIIEKMVKKSLQYFHNHLSDEIIMQLESYQGTDFKHFVEMRLQRNVQQEFNNWLGVYGPRLSQALHKFELGLFNGLEKELNKQIQITSLPKIIGGQGNYSLQLNARDLSNTDVEAGALVAAGGIGLTLLVGSALMPFVSFAAMPMVRRKMLERKLTAAREELIPELQSQLAACIAKLTNDLRQRVAYECNQSEICAYESYERFLSEFRSQIEEKITLKNKDQDVIRGSLSNAEYKIRKLQSVRLEE